jgi:hypothetical protein
LPAEEPSNDESIEKIELVLDSQAEQVRQQDERTTKQVPNPTQQLARRLRGRPKRLIKHFSYFLFFCMIFSLLSHL